MCTKPWTRYVKDTVRYGRSNVVKTDRVDTAHNPYRVPSTPVRVSQVQREPGAANVRSESRAMETGPGGWFIFPGAVQRQVLPLVRRVIFPH